MSEKKYSKLQIFLFLFFFIVLVIFFVNIFNFLTNSYNSIKYNNEKIKCMNLNFDITSEIFGSSLYINIINYGNINITKITIFNDENFSNQQNEKNILKDTNNIDFSKLNETFDVFILGGNKEIIKLDIEKFNKDKINNLYLYPNDCINAKKLIKI